MLTLTSPVETPLHRLPAGAKLLGLCAVTVVLFALDSPWALAIAGAAIVLLHLTGGVAFLIHAARMLRPLWPFVLVVGVWHIWTGDLRGGASVLLRMTAAVAAANLVTMTTRLTDMIAVFEWIATPLAPILPPRRLALAMALVIRFIPVLSDRMQSIRAAWSARSPRRPGWRILVPATLSALDDADRVAESLRARSGSV